ncbi:hypothetical protein Ddye_019660 [Dipteronia dyeriana]|uniref:Uncharacterized protein n=1 Tax=Dipteronia dyeriana TaxID=168575 RepID=A0AAD9TYC5_9ROSI|nr:hypothetical protein Ddye_019660 [Dipteronia dyeriana]
MGAQCVYILMSDRHKETRKGFNMQAFSGLCEFVKLSAASAVMLCLETWYFQILVLIAGLVDNPELSLDSLAICGHSNQRLLFSFEIANNLIAFQEKLLFPSRKTEKAFYDIISKHREFGTSDACVV